MKNNNTPYCQSGDPPDQVNASSSTKDLSFAPSSVSGMRVHWSDQSKRVTQDARRKTQEARRKSVKSRKR